MAAPSYATDLVNITTAESGTWGEITGYVSGGTPAAETDYYIQGTGCYSQSLGTKTGLQFSMYFDYGSDLAASITTGRCVFFWQVLLAGNAMETFANGGLRLCIGSSATDFKCWISGGRDFGRNPYGGWQNIAIDPRYNTNTSDYTLGAPSGVWRYFGSIPNTTASISKGSMHALDAIRYGRGQLTVTNGAAADGYATFAELSNANDANSIVYTGTTTNGSPTVTSVSDTSELYPGAPITGTGIPGSTTITRVNSATQITLSANATANGTGVALTTAPYNRWGLLQAQGSGYLWKGLISIGTVATACQFVDSNINITVDDTPRTYTTFNAIEIYHASTIVTWTNINITTLNAAQLSPGSLEMKADATVTLTNCQFTDMTTFVFDSNATINTTTFRRCGQVTQAEGTFTGCIFENSDAAVSLLVDNLNEITNSKFTSDGGNHAIELTSAHVNGTFSLIGCTFSNYAESNGSSGNEVIYNNSTGAVTINVVNCTGTISIRNGDGASTTLVYASTLNIHVQDTATNPIENAVVAVYNATSHSQITNVLTDVNGNITQASAATNTNLYIRVRKSTTGTRYLPLETVAALSTNLSLTITMTEDLTAA